MLLSESHRSVSEGVCREARSGSISSHCYDGRSDGVEKNCLKSKGLERQLAK